MKSWILLPTLYWLYLVFPLALIVSDNSFQHLKWGYKCDAIAIRTLHSLDLKHCRGSCDVRNSCKSYSYHRNSGMCLLYDEDATTTEGSRTPGWVYSEKKAMFVDCQYCDDEKLCNVYGTCSLKECSIPTVFHKDSNIKGNMVSVGAKVVYECKDNPAIHNVSECLTTGQWSLATFKCPTVCTQLPNVHRGTFVTHGGVGEGAIGKVLCGEATDISFGDTAICQSTGYWHITEFVCWYLMQDELDGETRQIHNPYYNQFWNFNIYGDHTITAENISNATSSQFEFQYQLDSTYKILTTDGFVCSGIGTNSLSLYTMALICISEDHKHFYMYFNAVSSCYTLISKAEDKYVKVNSQRRVRIAHKYGNRQSEFQIFD